MPCPLCHEQDATYDRAVSRIYEVNCPSCGRYSLTHEANDAIGENDVLRFKLASWICEQTAMGMTPRVSEKDVEGVRALSLPNVKKRVEFYLGSAIKSLGGQLTGGVGTADNRLRVASWSYDPSDCLGLARYLENLGALQIVPGNQAIIIKVEAHLLFEGMVGKRVDKSQAFVAMWFDASVSELYEDGIAPAIRNAGYEPLRIDRREHEGKIDDQIIAEIRRSAFLVADFTGHRAGVYYEAGFAHGLGRRVLFSCKKDQINSLHFDVRQYNTILWENPQDILRPLQNRILALFGAGPERPNAAPI